MQQVKKIPTFQLRGFPGRRFRIISTTSTEAGEPLHTIQVKTWYGWAEFIQATATELRTARA